MGTKKQYPLRIDSDLWNAVEKWSADELRSVNSQLEYIIRQSLKQSGRLPSEKKRTKKRNAQQTPKSNHKPSSNSQTLE